MSIVIISPEKDLAITGQDVARLFFPDDKILLELNGEARLTLTVSASGQGQKLAATARLTAGDTILSEEAFSDNIPIPGDERKHLKRLTKLALFRLLCRYTKTVPGPWGILTGIRPTKIVHRLLDLNWQNDDIIDYLTTGYDMAFQKARLLVEIALRQRPYILTEQQAARMVCIYLGIPFCPTRCAYCSFPAYPVDRYTGMVEPFLKALEGEMAAIGRFLAAEGISVQTIYIGGGTPTVLDRVQLARVMRVMREFLVSDDTVEITLEAGRPDTLDAEKLKAVREYITRLSINPQSMNPETLCRIGRRHTPGDILDAVNTARELGYNNINMDIIIGLPGETVKHVNRTMEEISKLKPENFTVHTLAVKRASRINETRADFDLPPGDEVEKMLQLVMETARNMDMHPYYLYRQKKMVGPLENIGYTRAGFDCIYNIEIIEERQTIIGLGGGAGSKFVEPGTWLLTSHYNPKDPENYIERIDELIARKISTLTTL